MNSVTIPFDFRPGTFDAGIYHEVVMQNVYRVPERFESHDVVFDIGAHVGSFSVFAFAKGSRHIVAVEAMPENYRRLIRHTMKLFGAVHPIFGAVWRPNDPDFMCYEPCTNKDNTGGGNVRLPVHGEDGIIPVYSLDDLLDSVSGNVRFVKMDCEASEFPILYGCKQLHRIQEIAGEYHVGNLKFEFPDMPKCTVNALCNHLQNAGFQVETRQSNSEYGYFYAKR